MLYMPNNKTQGNTNNYYILNTYKFIKKYEKITTKH